MYGFFPDDREAEDGGRRRHRGEAAKATGDANVKGLAHAESDGPEQVAGACVGQGKARADFRLRNQDEVHGF